MSSYPEDQQLDQLIDLGQLDNRLRSQDPDLLNSNVTHTPLIAFAAEEDSSKKLAHPVTEGNTQGEAGYHGSRGFVIEWLSL